MRETPTNCPACGWPIERRSSRGRVPKYCDGACRSKAFRDRRAAMTVDQRRERLLTQIVRDDRIAWEHAVPYAIRAVPGLVIHRCYGTGFAALGRLRQAQRRLRELERGVAKKA